jgi:hypothetical protein
MSSAPTALQTYDMRITSCPVGQSVVTALPAIFVIRDSVERETLLRIAAQWGRLAEHKARKESEET